ncbi:hypothetical protein NVP1055O_56 [Vibrio phage 1.055.O._10N.286.55.E9]|nr:hypothetical protein NVP1055O_56 [Vibrio phage 1.055.O._10N.286.55.E9]
MDRVSETVRLPLKYNGWGEVVDALGDHAMNIDVDVNHETILGAINGYDALLVELAYSQNAAINSLVDHMSRFKFQEVYDEMFGSNPDV